MADITEIAVAAWRLEKWLDNVNVERKMAAKSALRAIKKYLQENQIEIVDLTGAKFDVGLAVSVVNNESDETDEDKLIISEMVKPIIKANGAVIQYGQVILGDTVKQPKANNVIEEDNTSPVEKEAIEIATAIEENKAETAGEAKQESPPTENKTGNKVPKILAWACVLVLQIVVIFLLIRTQGTIKTLKTENSANDEQSQVVVSKSQESVDLSGIESGISALDERISSIEDEMGNMNSSLDDVSDYIKNAQEAESTETRKEDEPEKEYITYTVQAGDSLISICNANGVDYRKNKKEILEINGIEDPNVIDVGQEIKLPKN